MNKEELLRAVKDAAEGSSRRMENPSATVAFKHANAMVKEAVGKRDGEQLLELVTELFSAWCRDEGDDFGLIFNTGEAGYELSGEGTLLRVFYDVEVCGCVILYIRADAATIMRYLFSLYQVRKGTIIIR